MTADTPTTNATVEVPKAQLEAFQALARSANQLLRDSKDFRQCVELGRLSVLTKEDRVVLALTDGLGALSAAVDEVRRVSR